MAILLHMIEEWVAHSTDMSGPVPKVDTKGHTRHTSFVTRLTLDVALARLRLYEKAHRELHNKEHSNSSLSYKLLGVSPLGPMGRDGAAAIADLGRASLIEDLPQKPGDFE